MKVIISSDHAGYRMKEFIKRNIDTVEWLDLGTDNDEVSCSYSEYARKASQAVLEKRAEKAILICGTGIGMSIGANRFRNIRAAVCVNEKMAEMSRKHNDSNILCLGSRIIDNDTALKIVNKWLITEFEGGRHIPRIKLMDEPCLK